MSSQSTLHIYNVYFIILLRDSDLGHSVFSTDKTTDDDILYQQLLLFSCQCCSSESSVACLLGS